MNSVKSLYIHVPYCKHLCNYCDFYKLQFNADEKQLSSYHDYLLSTAEMQREFFSDNGHEMRPLNTLYLGGGTPSLWGTNGASFFKTSMLNKFFKLDHNCEFTMEFDPGSWTEKTYHAWKELGVNRLSVGAQAFSDQFVKILDRHHDLSETKKTLSYFQKQQENFSVDLLIGVPYSKEYKRDLKTEIDQLISYDPNHLSLYILKTRSNYVHKHQLPDEDYVSDEYLFVCEYLAQLGFEQYEVSNFARPGHESRHNLAYWDQSSVAALGPNATGYIHDGSKAIRYQWGAASGHLSKEVISGDSLRLEQAYLALRTSKSLELGEIWNPSQMDTIKPLIEKWTDRGLYCAESKKLTSSGYLVLDSLIDELFTHKLL